MPCLRWDRCCAAPSPDGHWCYLDKGHAGVHFCICWGRWA